MASASIERTGIVQDEVTGEAFIPASRRPDGTWRKPRRVKEGYVPQEEMPTYENRGVQWLKSKPSLPPGLNPNDTVPAQVKIESSEPLSKAAKKNLKRKEKKKQQQDQSSIQNVTQSLAQTKITPSQSSHITETQEIKNDQSGSGIPDKQEITKKLRNLKKKLKQVEDLEEKIKSGALKEPQKEQLEKIAKKNTLIDEIEDLELLLDD